MVQDFSGTAEASSLQIFEIPFDLMEENHENLKKNIIFSQANSLLEPTGSANVLEWLDEVRFDE